MKYRKLPHGNEQISVVGMGSSVVGAQDERGIVETVDFALAHGVNYFDMAGGHASIFPAYGKALEGRRDQALLQVHFGADYTSGEYGWNPEPDAVKRSIEWQLKNLRTDYIDFGFMHCLDEEDDLNQYVDSGVLAWLLDLKAAGVVRHVGLSTHQPSVANRVLDMGILDMMMFSINPMYDYGEGEFANGAGSERYTLYRRCEKEGVGISVMKPFGGGLLLDAAKSPFHRALSTNQCIQYALDRPGVLTVLPGPANADEMGKILSYFEASEDDRDYSAIGSFAPSETKGICVYCSHCHPCPMGLEISLINRYYDLSRLGDGLAREHYLTLAHTASECIACGRCNHRCPFSVDQMNRMAEIAEYFGR